MYIEFLLKSILSHWPIKLQHQTIFSAKSACTNVRKLTVENGLKLIAWVSSPSTRNNISVPR